MNSILYIQSASLGDPRDARRYPTAFLEFVRKSLQQEDGRTAKPASPGLKPPPNAPVDPVLFVQVIRAVVSWKMSPERIRIARFVGNVSKRCERRARKRSFATYAEEDDISELSKLFGPTIGARWIAYLLWGFSLKQLSVRPSLHYLRDIAPIYDWHIHGIARRSAASLSTQFMSWRSNIYTLRSRNRWKMDADSIQHFEALFGVLAIKRGLVRRSS